MHRPLFHFSYSLRFLQNKARKVPARYIDSPSLSLLSLPLYWLGISKEKSTIRAIGSKTSLGASEAASTGFAPIARDDARVLILGSLPGQRSIKEAEYYANPQNAFWPIMCELFSIEGNYERRCEQLRKNGIAVWDVLARSIRPGSMDADIRTNASKANDFQEFFHRHRQVELVCFNGKKAAQLFERLVDVVQLDSKPEFITMPSTSPAYASMPFAKKLELWSALDY